ncbi:hypothetical protein GCM10022286_30390 [Gryllotalpicola daejeonensis]|uniref:Hydroxyacid dehydrogenase n=2 Tax=Gryllotalpicola daejeonensis TaxID=993087 RepID=A0ABP7ZNN3_9MICO
MSAATMPAPAQQRQVRALALPRAGDVDRIPRELLAAADFVLVSHQDQYRQAVKAGAQPILVTRSFSVTDSRGRARLLLGALIGPWRWRRVLLNEGIGSLAIAGDGGLPSVRGALGFRIAALLAGIAVVRPRTEGALS